MVKHTSFFFRKWPFWFTQIFRSLFKEERFCKFQENWLLVGESKTPQKQGLKRKSFEKGWNESFVLFWIMKFIQNNPKLSYQASQNHKSQYNRASNAKTTPTECNFCAETRVGWCICLKSCIEIFKITSVIPHQMMQIIWGLDMTHIKICQVVSVYKIW